MGDLLRPAAVVLAAGAFAASAQEPATVFREATEVVVVNVDVTVTDRQGRPILGLGPEDFIVREDGEPVEITNFAVVDQRRSEPEPAVPAGGPGSAEGDGATPVQATEEPLDLFLYVDNFNLLENRRDRVLDTLAEHLDRTLRPADRVTVIVHNGGHIAFLLRRSSSRPEITAAIESIRGMRGGGIDDRLLLREAIRGIETVFELYDGDVCSEAEGALLSVASAYADAVGQHVRASIQGLETLVRVLAAVEGRKPVLHVSDGFPAHPGLGIFAHLDEICGTGTFLLEASPYDETERLTALTSSANANRVTFFPLQAGLAGESGFRASTQLTMRQNLQAPLQAMATETGGRAVLNTNSFDGPLRALDGDVRVYYSIGYRPRRDSGSGQGENRRIDVRLVRDIGRAEVRFRRRYSLKTADERLAERTLGALHGFEDNPLGVSLRIGVLDDGSPPRSLLMIAVPRERLTYVPLEGRWECEIVLAIAHAGENGGEARQRRITLRAESSGSEPPDGIETLQVAVAASPGNNRYAVGVTDVVSSRVATVSGMVEIPPESR